MNEMQFILPRELLPQNKVERRLILDEYFPSDLIPFEQFIENEWKITSFISDDPSYYVDPLLEKSLKNWVEAISIENMSLYRCSFKNAMISFNDSWSIYYWSLVMNWLSLHNKTPNKITILHIDDHKDLASPLITSNENNYSCIFSKRFVDFNSPESIEMAIINKSIDIGSFIAPFLHHWKNAIDILHLRYAHKGKIEESYLNCTFSPDTLLSLNQLRPALKLEDAPGRHSYFIGSDLSELLKKEKDSSLLFLHIDCDAFNNRYNRDSCWHQHSPSIDLNINDIKNKISDLLYQVSQLSTPVYMNIALSPGFFPSEYWKETCTHIFTMAEKYGILRDDAFSEYLRQLNIKEFLL